MLHNASLSTCYLKIKIPQASLFIPGCKLEVYIECVFADDASPDKSMGIVQSVLQKYPARKNAVKIIRYEKIAGYPLCRGGAFKEHPGGKKEEMRAWTNLSINKPLREVTVSRTVQQGAI